MQKDLIGKLVKLKSGRIGIVLSTQETSSHMFFVVLVSGIGLMEINEKDVEIIK